MGWWEGRGNGIGGVVRENWGVKFLAIESWGVEVHHGDTLETLWTLIEYIFAYLFWQLNNTIQAGFITLSFSPFLSPPPNIFILITLCLVVRWSKADALHRPSCDILFVSIIPVNIHSVEKMFIFVAVPFKYDAYAFSRGEKKVSLHLGSQIFAYQTNIFYVPSKMK